MRAQGVSAPPSSWYSFDALAASVGKLRGGKSEIRLRSARYNSFENWAVAVELATGFDGRHGYRVGRLAAAIYSELGLAPRGKTSFELACRLNDVGNMLFAFSLPNFSEKRSRGMLSVACRHTVVGAELLESVRENVLSVGALIAKTHHEWWNGCGFPLGIRGTKIPIEGRICALADVFWSLVIAPAGRPCWSVDRAMLQIQALSGVQLDPILVDVMRKILSVGLIQTEVVKSRSKFSVFELEV